MKQIGLPAKHLIERGYAEYMASSAELVYEIFQDKELLKRPADLQAHRHVSDFEAVIRAVALMIEENNNELLKQLKQAGVIPDSD
jgi:hypothetical protein